MSTTGGVLPHWGERQNGATSPPALQEPGGAVPQSCRAGIGPQWGRQDLLVASYVLFTHQPPRSMTTLGAHQAKAGLSLQVNKYARETWLSHHTKPKQAAQQWFSAMR